MWFKILLVFAGGGLGSLLRFGIGQLDVTHSGKFPFLTFWANAISAFILGLAFKYYQEHSALSAIRFFVIIGFCGGLSTFSTFTAENYQLIRQGHFFLFAGYVLVSVLACLFLFWLGSGGWKQ